MADAVELDQLTRRFGSFTAVDRLTLRVEEGEVFGFLGSNGAGKSTAIRMLCGLLAPSSGSARVLGVDVAREPERVKERIGYMSQRFSLYDDLTVRQNLRFYGGVYGLRGDALAARQAWAVEMADLGGRESLLTGDLPGGWKQRLALACSLLHDPRLLFLDEPTSGVDPLSRRRFWGLIDSLAEGGVTVFVTTHYLDEAEHCDRIAVMHAGRLVALGTPRELKRVFAGRAVLEVRCPRLPEALEQLEGAPGVRDVSVFGSRLHVVVDAAERDGAGVVARLEASGNAPASAEAIVPSLEDVFLYHVATAGTPEEAAP
jgi:ABC-2 type transport system ATP-binding protein